MLTEQYEIRCATWYHLYNPKNVNKNYGGVLLLVKLKKYKIVMRYLN